MTLYLIGTPLGNLGDITPRAVELMKEVPILAVEKWTDTVKLLKYFEIGEKKIVNYDDKNSRRVMPKILDLLEEQDVALITSAGMPGVSDPGAYLVSEARKKGYGIVPIPGPSALSTAIASSGFSGHFWFVEFLPRTRGKIVKILKQAEELETNLVCFESTYRLTKTLELINELYPEIEVFVGKEMTKKFEQYIVGTAEYFLEKIKEDKDFTRGEFSLVIHFGKKKKSC